MVSARTDEGHRAPSAVRVITMGTREGARVMSKTVGVRVESPVARGPFREKYTGWRIRADSPGLQPKASWVV